MNRLLFYVLKITAFCCRMLSNKLYMRLIQKAHETQGVVFTGKPSYIDYTAHLDASGKVTLRGGVVISTKVVILSHDWSFLVRLDAIGASVDESKYDSIAFKAVEIGEHSFIGAGAIVLPGTRIGKYCIIGAGAVVKGTIEDYAIVVGNPAHKIGNTHDPKYKLLG